MKKRNRNTTYETISSDESIESLLGGALPDDSLDPTETQPTNESDKEHLSHQLPISTWDTRAMIRIGLPESPYVKFLSQYKTRQSVYDFLTSLESHNTLHTTATTPTTKSTTTTPLLLYLYGVTGSGKTALIASVLESTQNKNDCSHIPLVFTPESMDELSMLAIQRYDGTRPVTIVIDSVQTCAPFMSSSVLGLVGQSPLPNGIPVRWLLVGEHPSDLTRGVSSKTMRDLERKNILHRILCPLPDSSGLQQSFPNVPYNLIQTRNMHTIVRYHENHERKQKKRKSMDDNDENQSTPLPTTGTTTTTTTTTTAATTITETTECTLYGADPGDSYTMQVYREVFLARANPFAYCWFSQRGVDEFLSRKYLKTIYWAWVRPNVAFSVQSQGNKYCCSNSYTPWMDMLSLLDAYYLPVRRDTHLFQQTSLLDNMRWLTQHCVYTHASITYVLNDTDQMRTISVFPSRRYGQLVDPTLM